MEKEIREKEYASLRDEVLKWQDRRITFSQIAITLVTVYTGYMLKDQKDQSTNLTWPMVSIFPLLILSITIHINKIFELFQIRGAQYLRAFYGSIWEEEIQNVSLSKQEKKNKKSEKNKRQIPRVGYNRSMAIVYFFIALTSTFVFASKFHSTPSLLIAIFFAVTGVVFLSMCVILARFDTNCERNELFKKWMDIKDKKYKVVKSEDQGTNTLFNPY